jgi:nucleoside-diphosphate-sugar epimerase
MRVLVTGAAGFLGRHLAARLAGTPGIELTRARRADGDLSDPAAAAALLEVARPQQIFHLAGGFTGDLGADYRANVVTTENLLAAARPPCRILLVGSAAEYGAVPPGDCPVRETQPLRPSSGYGVTKVCQTLLMRAHDPGRGVEVVMARLFNLLGEGMSPRLVVGRVQAWLAARGPGADRLQLGNLDEERDYLPVEEAVAALERVMDHAPAGEVVHVASGRPVAVRAIVQRLLADAGVEEVVIDEDRSRRSGVPVIFADISKLTALERTRRPE